MTQAERRSSRLVLPLAMAASLAGSVEETSMRCQTDPITRLIHVVYRVPADAPERVTARCAWSPHGQDQWQPARVLPLLSETAWGLLREDDWAPWAKGEVTELRPAGLERTVVFNPYPEAQPGGLVDLDFRVELFADGDRSLSRGEARIQADNRDVVYVDDWAQALQKDAVSTEAKAGCWQLQCGLTAGVSPHATGGTRLVGTAGADLPQLTLPLALKGPHAIFVYSFGGVQLRLSGDVRSDRLGSRVPYLEELWRWQHLDWQHLIVRQSYAYTGPASTSIDYVKLVPLTDELVARLDGASGPPDRFVASYWEPYSYAFSDNVQDAAWHLEYLDAYRDADVSLVDTQLGRFGMKMVYETRVTDQLLYQTQGDPIGAIANPQTTNVGRMQQYSNTLQATLWFAKALGLKVHANFGATNCYPGSPLQGDFSKQHPEWMRGHALRYEVPEVRRFVLAIYRETLEIGAGGLSIDFCRYPEGLDTAATGTGFFRELRALADEYGRRRGTRVPILVRFPAHGVRLSENFDYATWVREGLVDYLCPSNIQGRFHHFEVGPYVDATAGTSCTLLPQIDALEWGLPKPGPFLWRVRQLYEQGVKGIYVYQGDAMVLGSPVARRCMRALRSTESVRRFWAEDASLRPARSKAILISHASQYPGYHSWERLHVWLEGIPMASSSSTSTASSSTTSTDRHTSLATRTAAATRRSRRASIPCASGPAMATAGWSAPSRSSARDEVSPGRRSPRQPCAARCRRLWQRPESHVA
jgi:hypothetical protein